jgi:predicted aldo/keto reductase-like oxidoreductase
MTNLNRRGFLRKGFTGVAGIALTPVTFRKGLTGFQDDIIFRTLGRTGMKVPVISFGVMRSDNANLCKAAYEKGIRMFDTANGYQNGNNETMLGNLLKDYPRNSFFLATKVKPAGVDRDGRPSGQTTAEDFIEKFNTSLERLKMDYVDILYIHDVSNPELLEFKPVVNTIKKLKKEGKAKFIGFSTHRNQALVIDAAASMGDWDVILTAYNFQLANREEIDASVKKAAATGIGIVAMKTLAGGGFIDKEKTKPINSTAAIKWVLSNPDIATTIPGMTSFDQLDLNVKMLTDLRMTDQEKNDILIAGMQPGLFCSGCGECLKNCPAGLPVPDLMRAYMYSYGYSSPAEAYKLLSELGTGADPCRSCTGGCKIQCGRKFDIKEKISDVSRLVNVPVDFLT